MAPLAPAVTVREPAPSSVRGAFDVITQGAAPSDSAAPSERAFSVPSAAVTVTGSSERISRHLGPVRVTPARMSSTGPSASTVIRPSREPESR